MDEIVKLRGDAPAAERSSDDRAGMYLALQSENVSTSGDDTDASDQAAQPDTQTSENLGRELALDAFSANLVSAYKRLINSKSADDRIAGYTYAIRAQTGLSTYSGQPYVPLGDETVALLKGALCEEDPSLFLMAASVAIESLRQHGLDRATLSEYLQAEISQPGIGMIDLVKWRLHLAAKGPYRYQTIRAFDIALDMAPVVGYEDQLGVFLSCVNACDTSDPDIRYGAFLALARWCPPEDVTNAELTAKVHEWIKDLDPKQRQRLCQEIVDGRPAYNGHYAVIIVKSILNTKQLLRSKNVERRTQAKMMLEKVQLRAANRVKDAS